MSRGLGLRARVTIAFAGLALLLSATLAVFAYELTRAFLIDRREQSAKQEAFLNARAVRDALRVNALDVSGALRQAQTGSDSAVVMRVGTQWFGTSVGVGRDDVPQSLRHLVAGGSAGTQNTALASVPNIGVGVPLPAVDGAFFEFIPARELDQTLSLLARALAAAALVATILGAVVGRYASGRVLRPVRRMALTAGGIADGALDERLDAEGDSDLEPLVDAFNSMVFALRTRIEREARFASNVSHELRTPIATMTAALNVARRRQSGEAAEAALDMLDLELQKFRGLVLDLLEVSRMEGGVATIDLERVNPATLVREVLRSTERTTVAVDVEGAAPAMCVIDRRRISQVLTNLLDNADAYGDGAVRVVVSGTTESVLIAVDDAGPGVAPEERIHVFERFARGGASESKPGTGLGLALVSEHVRLHEGQVWVDDSPEGGARFVIELPEEPDVSARRAAVVGLLLVCAACGVPTHDSANKVDKKDVPFQLLDRRAGPPVQDVVGAEEKLIYFARDRRLVATTRKLAPASSLSRLLDALGRGPNRNEVDAGLRSALPDESRFPDISISRGTATVDLSPRFTALSGEDQVIALAQLVYTITAQPGIGLVRFTLDGQPTEVPRANGSLTAAPVSRDDYATVAPVG